MPSVVVSSSLSARYAELRQTPSDINEHLPTFVALCEQLDARKVVELGTRSGVSTIAWLYGLEARGHLWSVDLDPAPPLFADDHPGWTFIRGDDLDPGVYTRLPGDVDIVFVDTSHAYDQTLRELNLYRWLVRPGGRIVLHDTALPRPEGVSGPSFPVRRAIDAFCTGEGLRWTDNPACNGLGIIEVRR